MLINGVAGRVRGAQGVINVVGEATGVNGLGRAADHLTNGRFGAAAGEAALAAIPFLIPEEKLIGKAVNLPAWKSIGIDMEHIASGHIAGGARSAMKTLFPEEMSSKQIERAVRTAYRYGKKLATQGDRVLVGGRASGLNIEMWVNTAENVIETAYPR